MFRHLLNTQHQYVFYYSNCIENQTIIDSLSLSRSLPDTFTLLHYFRHDFPLWVSILPPELVDQYQVCYNLIHDRKLYNVWM